MSTHDLWRPNPPAGTEVAGGFDGSENDDWTAIKLETRDGLLFTPRFGPDQSPTIWNPANCPGHRIPRGEVRVAWGQIVEKYKVRRVYCDPGFHDESSWESDIEQWALDYGEDVFVPWPTNQIGRMYPALTRFVSDLRTGRLKHDGCPITTTHVGNVRKVPKSADRYVLGKPAQSQKIDAAVTSVLAHEAAADLRADGWTEDQLPPLVFSM